MLLPIISRNVLYTCDICVDYFTLHRRSTRTRRSARTTSRTGPEPSWRPTAGSPTCRTRPLSRCVFSYVWCHIVFTVLFVCVTMINDRTCFLSVHYVCANGLCCESARDYETQPMFLLIALNPFSLVHMTIVFNYFCIPFSYCRTSTSGTRCWARGPKKWRGKWAPPRLITTDRYALFCSVTLLMLCCAHILCCCVVLDT